MAKTVDDYKPRYIEITKPNGDILYMVEILERNSFLGFEYWDSIGYVQGGRHLPTKYENHANKYGRLEHAEMCYEGTVSHYIHINYLVQKSEEEERNTKYRVIE